MTKLLQDLPAARKASAEAQAKVKAENAKHTPGPWVVRTIDQSLATVETQDGRYIIGNAGQLRADDWKTGHIERRANARLIAAAPEMFAALQEVVEHWTSQFERRGHAAPEWCKKARAAIAKAQGAQQ